MTSNLDASGISLGLVVFALLFVSSILGLVLQRVLPEKLTTGGSRDMAGAVSGLLTLLLALVLGLMIWTAFGVYSVQKASVQQLAVTILRVDNALHDYGDQANEGRTLLRDLARRGVQHVWFPDDEVAMGYVHAMSGGQTMQRYLDSLQPTTDLQKAAKVDASAAAASMSQIRLQMAMGLNDPVSYPLLELVIAWAMGLFFGYGFLSKSTVTAYIAAFVGALAIASAIYAIDDLSSPYSGLFQISSKPIADVLRVVDTLAARSKPH